MKAAAVRGQASTATEDGGTGGAGTAFWVTVASCLAVSVLFALLALKVL